MVDNKFVAALAAAGAAIIEMDRGLITLAAAGVACKYLGSLWNTYKAYYGDGGQARYTRFLLDEVRPKLFREITWMECTTWADRWLFVQMWGAFLGADFFFGGGFVEHKLGAGEGAIVAERSTGRADGGAGGGMSMRTAGSMLWSIATSQLLGNGE
ncbi:hypothetical protein PTTG_07712 [Puccinia triticina 1-1 BBBD Race 1]|uniref:Uncharacterized protein n=1 Tax=Puccinia triticina (isolate 1-1 / race 1 (BBBD)) TaxID=630390 RepID=A0A0C4F3N2_PUCT1|nr:hypothetical protein PTTG_07712 [Puccinia triticina 1-1 BBBD Race 1]